jgi:hypothetical protein
MPKREYKSIDEPVPGPPATGGVRKAAKPVRRALLSEINGPAGGAAPADDSVIVPGTPDDDWVSVASQDSSPPPPGCFRPAAASGRRPPGAVVFNAVAPARDPRLMRPVAGPNNVSGVSTALVKRVEDFTKAAPVHITWPRGAFVVSGNINDIQLEMNQSKSSFTHLVEQKYELYTSLDLEFQSISGLDTRNVECATKAIALADRLLGVVQSDAKYLDNLQKKEAFNDRLRLDLQRSSNDLVGTVNSKLTTHRGYIKDLQKMVTEGVSVTKELFDEVVKKTTAAETAATVAKNAATVAEQQRQDAIKELHVCQELLAQRTEVLEIFKHSSVIPSCGKCHQKVELGQDLLYKLSCGVLRCAFCKNGDRCPSDTCNGSCSVLYETTAADYLTELEFVRKHVLDKYHRIVIDFEDEYAEAPKFLADYRKQQHLHLSTTRF